VIAPTADDARAARARTAGTPVRTPLVRFGADDAPADLKLENLQPIGSFKIRGASNAMALAGEGALRHGVWTASAGNMAQGVAFCARRAGIPCTVVVPETAPLAKRRAIERLGGKIVDVPVEVWIEIFKTRRHPGMEGLFVHPFSDPAVMAGNGVIALEILEDVPQPDAVLVPYGGGGLICGIASVLAELSPRTKIFACEVSTAAPLAASRRAGRPVTVPYTPSFVDGIGAPVVFDEMFELGRGLIDDVFVSTPQEIAAAVRLLAERNHVIAEGAGAAGIAALLSGKAGPGTVVCIVSGGNIDAHKLSVILEGGVP